MTTSLDLQLYALFALILTGMALGLLYDVYRAARAVFQPRPVATSVGDVLFFIAVAIVVGYGLWLSNWGELRLYVLIGTGLGLAVYHELASPTVLRGVRGLLRLGVAASRALWRGLGWLGATAFSLVMFPLVQLGKWCLHWLARCGARVTMWKKRGAKRIRAGASRVWQRAGRLRQAAAGRLQRSAARLRRLAGSWRRPRRPPEDPPAAT